MRHLLMGIAAATLVAATSQANPGNGDGNGNGHNEARGKSGATGEIALKSHTQGHAANPPKHGQNKKQVGASPNAQPAQQKAPATKQLNKQSRGPEKKNSGPAPAQLSVKQAGIADRAARPGLTTRYPSAPRLIQGCPPGLTKKNNGCTAPGQMRPKRDSYAPAIFGLPDTLVGKLLYNNGYLLQTGPSGVSAWLPLLGGALATGLVWPGGYESRRLPDYYEKYYNLGGRETYRYADRVVYRVDPHTSAITSVVALLTGDDFAVGQPVPAGYEIYNVPLDYRDRYYDRPDRQYRYSDGQIYQIDPKTQLVVAAIEMLT